MSNTITKSYIFQKKERPIHFIIDIYRASYRDGRGRGVMEIVFTQHPFLDTPSDEDILLLLKNDPKLLSDMHILHERIQDSIENPLYHGFDLDGWDRIRDGLSKYNDLTLGGNRSGKTTGCAKIVMEAVTKSENGHIVCFSQNADTSVKVQQSAIRI